MCFSYVHEFDLQSLKQLLTCNIKSNKLKSIYIYIYMTCVMISTISLSNCNLWCDSMHVKKKTITLQFHKCSKKTKPILFSHYYKSKKVQTHTYTHIKDVPIVLAKLLQPLNFNFNYQITFGIIF
jgi:hypothetical protein